MGLTLTLAQRRRLRGLTPVPNDVGGTKIFSTPDAAAKAAGGLRAIEKHLYPDERGGVQIHFSVLWDEEGWRGGAGGGIKAITASGKANIPEGKEPFGYVVF